MQATNRTILFSDFTCPYCFATWVRIDALGLRDQVAWAGVEHAPDLPMPRVPSPPEIETEFREEIEDLATRATELRLSQPSGKPRTRNANCAVYVAIQTGHPSLVWDLKLRLYRALWQDDLDISDRTILQQVAGPLDLELPDPWPAEVEQLADNTQVTWRAAGGKVPRFMRPDRKSMFGLFSANEIQDFLVADQTKMKYDLDSTC